MNRRGFLKATVPTTLGLSAALKSGPAAAAGNWTIANSRLRIVLSAETKGGLSEFTDLRSGQNFIAHARPLYRIFVVKKGKDVFELNSQDAEALTVDRVATSAGEKLTLTYGRHRSLDIRVVGSVVLDADSPLSRWRISVQNNSSRAIRALFYPVVEAPLILGSSGQDDFYMSGAGGGMRRAAPGGGSPGTSRKPGSGSEYPHGAALQLQAYYDDTVGLYLATHDSGINVKHFGFARLQDGLDVSIEHNFDERPGLSFDLPYDTVLATFHGDWYAAADLYKQWATKQPWCARKKAVREDLPDWLKEPRPVLLFECRADYQRVHGWVPFPPSDYPNGKFWPAKKIVPLSRKYSELFGSPVVVWYNGWEKFGNPAGPVDSLPPLEGAASLKAAMEELSRDGHIPYMAVWGNHWIFKRTAGGYFGWEHFQREGAPLASLTVDAKIPKLGGAEYAWVPICQGSEKTQQLLVDYFGELMNLGAVAMEYDHQSWPSQCYSDQHGHPPGFGSWMGQRTLELFRKVRRMAKKRNPRAAMSVEGPGEAAIADLDFMLARPYFWFLGFFPLFTYVYHEYVPLLGGDGRYGIAHLEEQYILHAANFAYGHMPWVTVGDNIYDFDVNPDYPIFTFIRNITEAHRSYARDYLVFGRMLRPTPLQCSKVKVDTHVPLINQGQGPVPEDQTDPPQIEVPTVMHGVWASQDNKIGYTLVNWTGEVQEVTLGLLRKDGRVALVSGTGSRAVPEKDVRGGQITLSVPARGVLLVEHV